MIGQGNPDAHSAMGLDAGGKSSMSALATAKAEREKIQTELIRAKAQKLSGDLVSRQAVTEAVETSAVMVRDAFRGLPLKLAPRLTGRTTEEIAKLLEDAIDETLLTAALSADQITHDVTI